MRIAAVAYLLLVAVVAARVALGALWSLGVDDQDNSPSAHLPIGLPALAGALAALFAAARIWRDR